MNRNKLYRLRESLAMHIYKHGKDTGVTTGKLMDILDGILEREQIRDSHGRFTKAAQYEMTATWHPVGETLKREGKK